MARESIKLTSVFKMNHVIKFVWMFDKHMPELMGVLKKSIGDLADELGKEKAQMMIDELFAEGSTLSESWSWAKPYCELYLKNYKPKKK